MKNRLTKTILTLLVISIIPMLSGFCIFQLSANSLMKINVAQTTAIGNSHSNIINNVSLCEGERPTENDSKQTLPASTNHKQKPLLLCCIGGSHSGDASVQTINESGISIPVAFLPQTQHKILSPRIAFAYNPNISPPTLSFIKTTVLRL